MHRFKALPRPEIGYLHANSAYVEDVEVKHFPEIHDEDKRCYVSVGIGRATRSVFIAIKSYKAATPINAFIVVVRKAASFKICAILIDSRKELTE